MVENIDSRSYDLPIRQAPGFRYFERVVPLDGADASACSHTVDDIVMRFQLD